MASTKKRNWPVVASVAVLLLMMFVIARDFTIAGRKEDLPPVIDFTWTPVGPVDLREMKGFLTMRDDYALDFTTYQMKIVELDRTFGLPIDGVIGKDYEQMVSLSLFADNGTLLEKGRVTLQFSIADDKGQVTTIERVMKLKNIVIRGIQ